MGNSINTKGVLFIGLCLSMLVLSLVAMTKPSALGAKVPCPENTAPENPAQAAAEVDAKMRAIPPSEHLDALRKIFEQLKVDYSEANRDAFYARARYIPPSSPEHAKAESMVKQFPSLKRAEELRQDAEIGAPPNLQVLEIALDKGLRASAHDPASVQDIQLGNPVPTHLGKTGCWRVPFTFRARNGFGALRLSSGTVWMKDGSVIQERIGN